MGPTYANSGSITCVSLSVTMMEPVCRSPCSSASACVMNLRLRPLIATLASTSSLSACTSPSSWGEVCLLCAATVYGSQKMTFSVSSHISGLVYCCTMRLWSPLAMARVEVENRVAAMYCAVCCANSGYVRPAIRPFLRMMAGGAMYVMAHAASSGSYLCTAGTRSGAYLPCSRRQDTSMRSRSCVSGQDSPTQRTYGRHCFTASPPCGPSTMYTKLMLPSPTSRTFHALWPSAGPTCLASSGCDAT
mmetsp:Transcript_34387/g.86942  ORF Transcript_34387/g.86942 Transcript_34387/m.86942 type:complete len:247 (-) Transcript_34387:106-846(-)